MQGFTLQEALSAMGVPPAYPNNDPRRGVFCNRTMNMRAIRAVGFDMDYTLIHYDVAAWEGKAYTYGVL
jgi:5'-nucleotidase